MTEQMKFVTDNDEIGYLAEGEPTDAQLRLQDEIDNTVCDFIKRMKEIYASYSGSGDDEYEWEIGEITVIREKTEEVLQLPDIY